MQTYLQRREKNSMEILVESTHYGMKFSIFTSWPLGSCTPEQQQQQSFSIIENNTYPSFALIQTELNVGKTHRDEYATRQKQ